MYTYMYIYVYMMLDAQDLIALDVGIGSLKTSDPFVEAAVGKPCMLRCTMLCYAMLYYSILYYIVLYYTMLYYIVLDYILDYAMLFLHQHDRHDSYA